MELSILTVCAVGLMGLLMSLILRQYNKEIAIIISAVTSLYLLLSVIYSIRSVLEMMKSYLEPIQNGGLYLSILCKVLITAYIADFTAQLCRDAGETSIASKIELAGKVIIFISASPVIISVFEMITKLITP